MGIDQRSICIGRGLMPESDNWVRPHPSLGTLGELAHQSRSTVASLRTISALRSAEPGDPVAGFRTRAASNPSLLQS